MSDILDVSEGKIALYAIGDSNVYVDVVFHDENFWMTQKAIAELFDTTVQNIGQHISRIFEDEELTSEATIKKIFIVQKEGKATDVYEKFRTQQDKDYISNFDKSMSAYLRGNGDDADGGDGK